MKRKIRKKLKLNLDSRNVEPGWEGLAFGIAKQALLDYALLVRYDDTSMYHNGDVISRYEINRFFNSGWCKFLCDGDDISYMPKLLEEMAR